MNKRIRLTTREKVEYIYPFILEKLETINDPDDAFIFLNICLENDMLTKSKAQKMFDKIFPKSRIAGIMESEQLEILAKEREKEEAINRRLEVMKKLGLDDKWEDEMISKTLEKKALEKRAKK